ncbi:Bro-N domain-containing protein [Fulvimarina sp. MAC8]|uniref:BRO-N domain-containing protein n=1 Tax=Fulvimarina sp. MAC8 TaxID=3162874 RepID=UPI0032EED9DC
MNTSLTTFDFNSKQLRTVMIEGQPWFVAADVCAVLGLTNMTNSIRPLADDEKGVNQIKTLGGPQNVRVLCESGLYKLVMRSDKAEARAFQDWVTRDVLPALRKDGMYVVGEEKVATGEMDEDELTLLVMERLRSNEFREPPPFTPHSRRKTDFPPQ